MPRISSTSSRPGTRPAGLPRRLVALLASATLVAGVPLAANATTTAADTGHETAASSDAEHDKESSTQWVGTWASVPTEVPVTGVQTFEDQTIRQVVHTSIGGDSLRVRLTNEFGDEPLAVGEVHVALRAGSSGTDIDPATDHVVTFSGQSAVMIPAGSPMVSDPVQLRLPPRSDLVVSVYLPEPTRATTLHAFAYQENEIAAGNVTDHASITATATTTRWHFLSGVSVGTREHGAAAVVTLGDSITNGFETEVNANHRYPDFLAERFATEPETAELGVLNLGVAGNRLLHDPNPPEGHQAEGYAAFFGHSALRRFDRDVVAQPGAEYVIVLLGVNDLGHPGTSAPLSEEVTAEEIIAAHRQLIARAHLHGMKVFGGTILPFQGDTLGFWSEENEAKRHQLNEWIRKSGEYDAVIDFDAALRDPANPLRLAPAYDSGDGLHPNDAGMLALARAVPLELFGAAPNPAPNEPDAPWETYPADRPAGTDRIVDTQTLRFAAPDDFVVGTALAGGGHHVTQPYPDPFPNDAEYRYVLAKEFSSVSPENQMKWEFIHPEQDVYNFGPADAVVQFAKENDQAVRGHTLLWHSQNPAWLETGDFTPDELREILREHIQTVVGRYAGHVQQWDVANEIFDQAGQYRTTENIWIRELGPGIVADAFRWAHEADPEALLFFNDYGVESINPKSDAYYALAQELLAAGVPVHGFSVQGHLSTQYGFPDDLRANLQRFDDLDLQTAVTEVDVRMVVPEGEEPTEAQEAQQADYYMRMLQACLAVEGCNSFTVWGFTDKYSWVPVFFENQGWATIMTKDFERKPAYYALRQALHDAQPRLSLAYVYRKINPDGRPGWGNSAMQRLVAVQEGHQRIRLTADMLPADVCGPGWAVQEDWTVGLEGDPPPVLDRTQGIRLGWDDGLRKAWHHSLEFHLDVPACTTDQADEALDDVEVVGGFRDAEEAGLARDASGPIRTPVPAS